MTQEGLSWVTKTLCTQNEQDSLRTMTQEGLGTKTLCTCRTKGNAFSIWKLSSRIQGILEWITNCEIMVTQVSKLKWCNWHEADADPGGTSGECPPLICKNLWNWPWHFLIWKKSLKLTVNCESAQSPLISAVPVRYTKLLAHYLRWNVCKRRRPCVFDSMFRVPLAHRFWPLISPTWLMENADKILKPFSYLGFLAGILPES
jgi:hypothetical protein